MNVGEHCHDLTQLKTNSHMLKHIVEKHEEEELGGVTFLMKAMKFHRSAFERQIYESVMIQANRHHRILNSKAEYKRCALPRLSIKLGKRQIEEDKGK